ALQVNIQAAASGRDPDHAMQIIAAALHRQATMYLPLEERPGNLDGSLADFAKDGLTGYLARWALANSKPLVLFIDEADSLMDELFLAFLRQLRAGFEARPRGFPQSIALVGLRDVRDYKIRLRPDSASLGTCSPFNVKTESLFMNGFGEAEVHALLDQHSLETGQVFPSEVLAEIWRLTQGQPWLTNALANQIVAEVLGNDFSQTISLETVLIAREQLIQRRDTHLDSLADKLREPSVKQVATAILNGDPPNAETFDDAVQYVADLGLVTRTNPIRFANPIYQEIIPRILSADFQWIMPTDTVDPVWYIRQGRLDMDALLKAFQKFYRRYSEAWLEKYDFREVGRQLLLMAFLQRILNGGGRIEREMAVGNGRCDLWIEFGGDQFVIELKINHDQWSEEDGLAQTARYLARLGLEQGYLLLFERDSKKNWEERLRWEEHASAGRRITLVGM
ncbi:MAG: ATP-binding protein, partial [Pseudomonadota bacterium]